MSKKRNILFLLIGLVLILGAQIYFLSTYDHFKAEGGLSLEMEIEPMDAVKQHTRVSLDFDYVMEDAVRTFESNGGDFLSVFAESNKKRLKQPLVKLFNYKEITELGIESTDDDVIAFLRENLDHNTDISASVLEKQIERRYEKNPTVDYDVEALKIFIKIPGLMDSRLEPEDFFIPQIDVGFYACATQNEVVNYWNSMCLLTEDEPEPESEELPDSLQPLVDINKPNLSQTKPEPQTLKNTVFWTDYGLAWVKDQDKSFVDQLIHSEEVQEVLPEELEFRWSLKTEQNGEEVWNLHIIKIPRNGVPAITNEDIMSAELSQNEATGEPVLNIRMTQEGAERWARMTAENINRNIAMCINETVFSAPRVVSAIHDGNTQILGSDAQNMKDIEVGLNARALSIYPVCSMVALENAEPPLINFTVQIILLILVAFSILFFGFRYFKLSRTRQLTFED